jgi:hypothetical protein
MFAPERRTNCDPKGLKAGEHQGRATTFLHQQPNSAVSQPGNGTKTKQNIFRFGHAYLVLILNTYKQF